MYFEPSFCRETFMALLSNKSISVETSVGIKATHTYGTSARLQPSVNQAFFGSPHRFDGSSSGKMYAMPEALSDSKCARIYKLSSRPCLVHTHGKSSSIVVRSLYGSGTTAHDGAGGDPKIQQMLVDVVRIQVGKVRMAEFVDERSQHLRNIADEAIFEYDQIAYRTMKGLDATGSRVLRQLDADANAIVKDLMIARAELEAQSRDFEEFQIRIAYSRNEGLFFKNLYRSPQAWKHRGGLSKEKLDSKVAIVEMDPGHEFGAGYRQLLYGGLSLVMVSFMWSSSTAFMAGACMRVSKLASYGIIFSLLLAQLAYVKVITEEGSHDGERDKSQE